MIMSKEKCLLERRNSFNKCLGGVSTVILRLSDTALKSQELKIMQNHRSCHLTDGFTLILDNLSSHVC